MMIQIFRSTGKNGRFRFYCPTYPEISGSSSKPLLDAARALKSLGVATQLEIGLFREGRSDPDLISTVGRAADTSVSEPDRGKMKFVKYAPSFFAKEAA